MDFMRAPMFGVYGDGKWRIEGHMEPDIVIDNSPHEIFNEDVIRKN
jgi:hypothetical protein